MPAVIDVSQDVVIHVSDVVYRLCSNSRIDDCMTSPLSLSLVPGDVSSGIWLCKFLRAEMWGPAGYLPTLVHGSDSRRVCVRAHACVCALWESHWDKYV